jgi:hypothetical protein
MNKSLAKSLEAEKGNLEAPAKFVSEKYVNLFMIMTFD